MSQREKEILSLINLMRKPKTSNDSDDDDDIHPCPEDVICIDQLASETQKA